MMCRPGQDQGKGKCRPPGQGWGAHKVPVVWAVPYTLGGHMMVSVHVRQDEDMLITGSGGGE